MDGADRVDMGLAPIVGAGGIASNNDSRTNGRIECMFVIRFLRDSGKRAHSIQDIVLGSS